MKLAVSNIAWKPEENEAALELFRAFGVSGVEVAPTILFADPLAATDEEVEQARLRWNQEGIEIVAQQALLFGHPELTLFGDGAAREATADYLAGILRLGAGLGAGPHVFGSPRNRVRGELSEKQARSIAIPFFRSLGQSAQACGTVLCIEANAPDYGCDFATNTRDAVELVRQVDHPGFGFHLDTGVMTMNGESYLEALDLCFPYLRHVHISEPFLAPVHRRQSDHELLARALRERGYEGWVSIEMKRDEQDPVGTLRSSIQYAAGVYLA